VGKRLKIMQEKRRSFFRAMTLKRKRTRKKGGESALSNAHSWIGCGIRREALFLGRGTLALGAKTFISGRISEVRVRTHLRNIRTKRLLRSRTHRRKRLRRCRIRTPYYCLEASQTRLSLSRGSVLNSRETRMSFREKREMTSS